MEGGRWPLWCMNLVRVQWKIWFLSCVSCSFFLVDFIHRSDLGLDFSWGGFGLRCSLEISFTSGQIWSASPVASRSRQSSSCFLPQVSVPVSGFLAAGWSLDYARLLFFTSYRCGRRLTLSVSVLAQGFSRSLSIWFSLFLEPCELGAGFALCSRVISLRSPFSAFVSFVVLPLGLHLDRVKRLTSWFFVCVVLLGPGPISWHRDSGSSFGRSYSVFSSWLSLSSHEPRSATRIFILFPKGSALALPVSSSLSSYAVFDLKLNFVLSD
jgi:hypothetical protein